MAGFLWHLAFHCVPLFFWGGGGIELCRKVPYYAAAAMVVVAVHVIGHVIGLSLLHERDPQ